MSDASSPDFTQKVGGAVTVAAGLVAMPFLFALAPRFVISLARSGDGTGGLRTSAGDVIASARRQDDADGEMLDRLEARVKPLFEAEDWAGVSDAFREIEEGREALPLSGQRLIDMALDALRASLATEVYAPTMCNFEPYYVVPRETLAQFEDALIGRPDDHILTAITAQLFIDRGWSARGGGWSHEVEEGGWDELIDNFKAADNLLQRFDIQETSSPLLARVHFQLAATLDSDVGLDFARSAHEVWSDLDIGNPLPHQAFAFFSLPRWFGTWETFDAEARRAAERTSSVAGKSAYAQFYLKALDYHESDAFDRLDTDLFSEALNDIVERDGDPSARALRLAAQLVEWSEPGFVTIFGEVFGRSRLKKRAALRDIARSLLDRHVTCLSTAKGSALERDALRAIEVAYAAELKAGGRLSFTPEGIRILND